MTSEELKALTETARDRMAEQGAAAEQMPVVVIAWDTRSGEVSCSAGGFDVNAHVPRFLRMAAEQLEAREKARATPDAARN